MVDHSEYRPRPRPLFCFTAISNMLHANSGLVHLDIGHPMWTLDDDTMEGICDGLRKNCNHKALTFPVLSERSFVAIGASLSGSNNRIEKVTVGFDNRASMDALRCFPENVGSSGSGIKILDCCCFEDLFFDENRMQLFHQIAVTNPTLAELIFQGMLSFHVQTRSVPRRLTFTSPQTD